MTKIYCVNCDKETHYSTRSLLKEYVVKDVKIKELITEAFCDECGNKVFVYEIEKDNQRRIYDAYKKKVGLLTSDEIIAIREKYHLTQKKLAKLINCGEKNIARYENCAIQDKTINLLIVLLDKHPELFGLHRYEYISAGWIVLNSIYQEESQKQSIETTFKQRAYKLKEVNCNA